MVVGLQHIVGMSISVAACGFNGIWSDDPYYSLSFSTLNISVNFSVGNSSNSLRR